MIWIVLICLLLVVVLYLLLVHVEAKHIVESAPREDMFDCPRHGLFHKKYALKLSGMTEEPIDYCPFCYEDRMKEAKSKVAK